MNFPKHINLHIEHQPHATAYQTVEEWLALDVDTNHYADITADEREKCVATGEVWVVQWYPNTPVGFCCVAASTLEAALAAANAA